MRRPSKLTNSLRTGTGPNTPGCAVAVMREGRIVYERGYGSADLDHDVPISPKTVFHVASMSKQFTAASIALLAQEGKLSFDDAARAYVPELPDFGTPITIRHLIHHTSGLRDQWELLGLAGWRYSLDLITNDDVLAVVSRQKDLNFAPGSVRRFSLKIGRKITRIQRETMERLMNYSWPGNVRELENVIERAVILSPGIELEVVPGVLPEVAAVASAQAAAPRPSLEEKSPGAPSPQSIDQVERGHILAVLMQTNWRIEGSDGAAALLNLNPSTLRSRMKKLGVRRSSQGVS